MPLVFSAEEVLETAEQIERNGTAFYSTAANLCMDPHGVELLKELASWEVSHTEIFHKMRESLTEHERAETVFDPDDELGLYLKSMADSVAFTAKRNPAEILGENPSYEKILKIALDMEKDTVIFYSNIKEMVPKSLGSERIDAIIKEELRHVAIIQKQLSQVQATS